MGRSTLLTPEVADGIILAIRAGAPLAVAAASQGVAESTFHEWVARGKGTDSMRPAEPVYAEFAERVGVAEAEAHIRIVGAVTQFAMKNPATGQGWLRMRYPKHYAERTEVSGPEGGPLATEISGVMEGMTDSELADALDRIARSRAAPARSRTRSKAKAP